MKVGIIGRGQHAGRRAQAVRTLGGVKRLEALDAVPDQPAALEGFLESLDVVFITVPTAEHYRVAEAAAKRGVHLFLEWPPATSTRECAAIVRLAEEAGVEAGVSRPLRFHAAFSALPEGWRPDLVLIRQEVGHDAAPWLHHLADLVDLSCALVRSGSVRRIDAEAVRSAGSRWPDALAFGIRFHSGAYVQGSMRRIAGLTGGELYVAGPGFQLTSDLAGTEVRRCRAGHGEENAGTGAAFVKVGVDPAPPVEMETAAFFRALADGRPAPVSVLEGLHTMRLVERLMEKLR